MILPPLPNALDIWLPAWLRRPRDPAIALGAQHLVLCVCDHFEPFAEGAGKAKALAAAQRWRDGFVPFVSEIRDSDSQPPRHTFFYSMDQYDPEVVERLAEVCRASGCEVEIRLPPGHACAKELETELREAKERLAGHGLLARDDTGETRYGFIQGHRALESIQPEGGTPGVSNYLSVLRASGCYADFTLPSVPHRSQTHRINSIYYARGTPVAKSHQPAGRVQAQREAATPAKDALLVVQGPLALDWDRRKWGLIPGVENGELTAARPPTRERLQVWLDCHINVHGRPSWIFLKLHTHGARADNARMLLGEPMRAWHQLLAEQSELDPTFHYHYASAREMVNIVHAAEAGHSGDPKSFRDYRYKPAPGRAGMPASQ